MWSSSYTQKVTGISVQRIWDVYSDVENWPSWQDDVQFAHLDGPFEGGGVIRFKPKGGPKVRIELNEVEAPSRFVDTTRFPLARMIDVHEFVESEEGVEIRNTTSVEGPLAWVWRKLVAEGVANSCPEQTSQLVARAAGV